MNGSEGNFGVYKWKVEHPNIYNDIPQMRSGGFQPPFIAGGNQTAYYLGMRGNNNTEPEPVKEEVYSAYIKVIKKHAKNNI
jgi:hypothetical protein